MISTRSTIFDTKEQHNNYALNSLEGILTIMKPLINKINKDYYPEILEINLRFLVNFSFMSLVNILVCLRTQKSKEK